MRIRRSSDRGRVKHGWLDARHTFSFGQYYDSEHVHFRKLRVINQDIVKPGTGFATHPHENMEIISYIIRGEIEHQDNMGNVQTLRSGDVQLMSAGTGVEHSEMNPSDSEDLELLQIWIFPEEKGLEPSYDQIHLLPEEKPNQLRLIASPEGNEGALKIRQDARVFSSFLEEGRELSFSREKDRFVWIQVVKGNLLINDREVSPGDGIAFEKDDAQQIRISGVSEAEFLLFDLS